MPAANSLADYSAAQVLQAACTADVRKGLLQAARANLRRTRSAEGRMDVHTLSKLPSRAFEVHIWRVDRWQCCWQAAMSISASGLRQLHMEPVASCGRLPAELGGA